MVWLSPWGGANETGGGGVANWEGPLHHLLKIRSNRVTSLCQISAHEWYDTVREGIDMLFIFC